MRRQFDLGRRLARRRTGAGSAARADPGRPCRRWRSSSPIQRNRTDAPDRPLAGSGSRQRFDLAKLKLPPDLPAQPALAARRAATRREGRRRRSSIPPAPTSASPSPTRCRRSPSPACWASPRRPRLAARAGRRRVERRSRPRGRPFSTAARLDSQRKAASRGLRAGSRAISWGVVLSGIPGRRQRVARPAIRRRHLATRRSPPSRPRRRACGCPSKQYQLGAVNYLILLNAQQTLPDRRHQPAARRRPRAGQRHRRAVPGAGRRLVEPDRRRSEIDGQALALPLPPVQDIEASRAGH